MTSSKMNIQIAFKGLDASDAVRDYATKRVSKLEKLLHEVTNCHFVFSIEKVEHIAQLHVNSKDLDVRAESRAETMYAAIDEVTDKILNQTRKFKEKHTNHAGKPHHNQGS